MGLSHAFVSNFALYWIFQNPGYEKIILCSPRTWQLITNFFVRNKSSAWVCSYDNQPTEFSNPKRNQALTQCIDFHHFIDFPITIFHRSRRSHQARLANKSYPFSLSRQ